MALVDQAQYVRNYEIDRTSWKLVQGNIGEMIGLVPCGCCQALETGKKAIERRGSIRLSMISSKFSSLSNWCSFLQWKGHGNLVTRPAPYQTIIKQRQNG